MTNSNFKKSVITSF